jgi:hypothetical protein
MFTTQFNQVFGDYGNLVFWTEVVASLLILGFYLFSLQQIVKTQANNSERNSHLMEMTVLVIFGLALMNLPGLIIIVAPTSIVTFENNWLNFNSLTPLIWGIPAGILLLLFVFLKVKKRV